MMRVVRWLGTMSFSYYLSSRVHERVFRRGVISSHDLYTKDPLFFFFSFPWKAPNKWDHLSAGTTETNPAPAAYQVYRNVHAEVILKSNNVRTCLETHHSPWSQPHGSLVSLFRENNRTEQCIISVVLEPHCCCCTAAATRRHFQPSWQKAQNIWHGRRRAAFWSSGSACPTDGRRRSPAILTRRAGGAWLAARRPASQEPGGKTPAPFPGTRPRETWDRLSAFSWSSPSTMRVHCPRCQMRPRFSPFRPPIASAGPVPVLISRSIKHRWCREKKHVLRLW